MFNHILFRTTACVFLTIALSFISSSPVLAQSTPGITTGSIRKLDVTPPSGGYFELPFFMTSFNNTRVINVPTAWTFTCNVTANPLTTSINTSNSSCLLTNKSLIHQKDSSVTAPYARNYIATVTNHYINVGGSQRRYSVNHGENKNEKVNGVAYQNSVNPDITTSTCMSQLVNGVYQDCNASYHSFITLSYGDSYPQTDLGPIIWPDRGYYSPHPNNSGVRWSHSFVRIPHGFVNDGYLYVYYHEQSSYNDRIGLKVARAPINNLTPAAFKKYSQGSWVPALPSGFDNNRITDFYNQPTSDSSPIIPRVTGVAHISMAVTKTQSGSFLGIEEAIVNNQWALRLYSTTDLVNFTLLGTVAQEASYAAGKLHYPVFLNAAGDNSSLVDTNNFYVVGSSHTGEISVLPLSVSNMKPSKPGDLNLDGTVNLIDFNLLITNFGNPYTILDFNSIISNFGK